MLEQFGNPVSGSLPTIVRSFKSAVTKRINELRSTPSAPVWRRNYYEHIIRNEDDLSEIREYVVNNPFNWSLDSENPESRKNKRIVPGSLPVLDKAGNKD